LLQFRNAFDLGGLYFSTNLILSQASVVVCALLYYSYYEETSVETPPEIASPNNSTFTNSTGAKFTKGQLQGSVGSLLLIFVLSFGVFMFKIERKYVKTFFSMETGHAKAKRLFRTGKTDFEKSLITTNDRRLWNSISDEVAAWLDENWDRWESDKPDWFTAVYIASIDDDIMPKKALVKENQKAGGKERRRSSFLERVSGRREDGNSIAL
jgi:hypothetical protein